MRQRDRQNWLREVGASQRNVVFPDTLQNEANGWRKLITSKRPLTLVQAVGIALLYLGMGMVLWNESRLKLLGGWVVLFVIFGVFFLILRWRVRCALRSGRPDQPKRVI